LGRDAASQAAEIGKRQGDVKPPRGAETNFHPGSGIGPEPSQSMPDPDMLGTDGGTSHG